MATSGTNPTKTRKLTRQQLAKIAPSHEALRFLEDLQSDVVDTLPAAITDTELAARYSLQPADGSKSASFAAQQTAGEVQALLMTLRTQRAALQAMQAQIDELRAQVVALQQMRSATSTASADLDETRALTLILNRS